MNEEIKDFFVSNGGKFDGYFLDLKVEDYFFEINPNNKLEVTGSYCFDELNIDNITLDRLKALIYGLTGKNLD